MKSVAVWAPFAQKIEVKRDDDCLTLSPSADASGWWKSPEIFKHGDDYSFLIDDEGPFPDPRSMWQPKGIHQASRVLEHSSFQWSDSDWRAPRLSEGVIYELHIGTFTADGTFLGAIEKLDYLVNLGITHVELMPANTFSGRWGWGYDGVQLFAPHHTYGSPDDLKTLVDACHLRGLAVILDVVYNHVGPTGNYLAKFGPYFTDKYHTPWGDAVNFDTAYSNEVRQFFIDNALMWLRDYHFDGLRLDAIHAIYDISATHILEALRIAVDELAVNENRELYLIAESDLNNPRIVQRRNDGGFGMDCQWSDDLHHSLHALLTGERIGYYADFGKISHLAKALQQAFVYDGGYSNYRKRNHGAKPVKLAGKNFLAYSQTHDQVGNRAKGDRLSQLVSPEKLKIAAVIVLTSRFIPLLFQGEEWGAQTPFLYFSDHQESELAEAVRRGRKNEFAAFGWRPNEVPDPQAQSTFEKSKLLWSEQKNTVNAHIADWYKQLIQLRKQYPQIAAGELNAGEIHYSDEESWLSVARGNIWVVCNFGDEYLQYTLPTAKWQCLLYSHGDLQQEGQHIYLCAQSVAILQKS